MASVCSGAFVLAGPARRAQGDHTLAARQDAGPPLPPGAGRGGRPPHPDGRYVTSAGISAGIDLALALVEDDHGAEAARSAARELVVFMQRPGGQSQFSTALVTPPTPQRPAALADRVRPRRPGRRPRPAHHGRVRRRQRPAPDPAVSGRTEHHTRSLGRARPPRSRAATPPRRAQRDLGSAPQWARQRRNPPPCLRPTWAPPRPNTADASRPHARRIHQGKYDSSVPRRRTSSVAQWNEPPNGA